MGLTERSYARDRLLVVGVIVAMAVATLWGQDKLPSAGVEAGANLPAQPIGPNDLVAISVYGAPELTRTARVSEQGFIRLPMVKDPVEARGLQPAQLEERIARALLAAEILVDPIVTVTIAEYHSRPISVAGAVHRPLTFQAVGKTSLLETLARAEGLTGEAGPEILISRSSSAIQRIPVKGLIDAADPALNVTLEGGEEVRVPPSGRVFVVGNVKKPGAFRLEDSYGMTVLKALALAEGLSPYATKAAYIYRRGEGLPASQEVKVDLRGILDRKSADVALLANDIFYIPDNRVGRMTVTALERTVGFAASTASGILILSHP
jgi:polysaccharide biosynthesis/export protein